MKQKEKLDLILKKLYELRDDKYSHTLTEIMTGLGIYESGEDMHRMAARLKDSGLAETNGTKEGVYVKIINPGIDYYDENLSDTMSETGKLIAILKWLYPRRHQGGMCIKLEAIMEELNIFESREEAERIADELTHRRLAIINPIEEGAGLVRGITSQGIGYCNDSSFTKSSELSNSVSYTVNAYNAVVGNNNNGIQQSTTMTNEAGELVRKILEGISSESQLRKEEKEELIEHVIDIKERLESGQKVTNFQWKALIGNTANLVAVADFALKLAQLSGFVPQIPIP